MLKFLIQLYKTAELIIFLEWKKIFFLEIGSPPTE